MLILNYFLGKITSGHHFYSGSFFVFLFGDSLHYKLSLGFPCGSDGKESACSAGDLDLIPGLERSPGEGNGYPLW